MEMNKKGFAVSMLLYSLVFVIVSLLYILLGIIKTRYNTQSELRNVIVEEINNQNE